MHRSKNQCHSISFELRKLIAEARADTIRFCRYLKITRLEDLPATRFQTASAALEAKKAKGGA